MPFVSEFEGFMGQYQQRYKRFASSFKWSNQALGLLSIAVLGVAQAGPAIAGPAFSRDFGPSAISTPTRQAITGSLITKDAQGQVNLRQQPSQRSPIRAQGDNQDQLYIFKSALTPRGERWYFVENVSTREQGWVHGDYVLLNQPDKPFPSIPNQSLKIDPNSMTAQWNTPHAVEERPEAGVIVARDVGAWVNLRAQTNTDSAIRAQVQPGEPVYIYRSAQFSSPAGRVRINQLWYYVALLESGVEGWVLSDYLESAWESDEPFDVGWATPQPGRLQSDQDAKVQLFEQAYGEAPLVGWGQAGDAVTLLRKLATARGDLNQTWYWVRLAGGQEGWVRGVNVAESS